MTHEYYLGKKTTLIPHTFSLRQYVDIHSYELIVIYFDENRSLSPGSDYILGTSTNSMLVGEFPELE